MQETVPDHGSLLLQARQTLLEASAFHQENVFLHLGSIGSDTVQHLLSKSEEYSIMQGDPVMLRKRLFSVLVEGLENIQRHASDEYNASATVLLRPIEGGYSILFGNGMPVIVSAILEQRLGLFNQMNDGELKEHYMKLLGNDSRTERGGAGLGLISIARKSTRPIRFESISVSDHMVYGMLQVNITLAG